MVRHTTGIVCCSMTDARCRELELQPMTAVNGDPKGTAFTVSCDLSPRYGISTGVSASDRARTLRALASPLLRPGDLNRPGHVFPLRYRPGGVLARDGHTEAAVDLSVAAGAPPVGVLCEIALDGGGMARLGDCASLAAAHGLPLVSVADLQRFRAQREATVRRTGEEAAGARRVVSFEAVHARSDGPSPDVEVECWSLGSGGVPCVLVLVEAAAAAAGPGLSGDGLLPTPGARVSSSLWRQRAVAAAREAAAGAGLAVVTLRPPAGSDGLSPSVEHPSAYASDLAAPPAVAAATAAAAWARTSTLLTSQAAQALWAVLAASDAAPSDAAPWAAVSPGSAAPAVRLLLAPGQPVACVWEFGRVDVTACDVLPLDAPPGAGAEHEEAVAGAAGDDLAAELTGCDTGPAWLE